jgi:hypothetical protein
VEAQSNGEEKHPCRETESHPEASPHPPEHFPALGWASKAPAPSP